MLICRNPYRFPAIQHERLLLDWLGITLFMPTLLPDQLSRSIATTNSYNHTSHSLLSAIKNPLTALRPFSCRSLRQLQLSTPQTRGLDHPARAPDTRVKSVVSGKEPKRARRQCGCRPVGKVRPVLSMPLSALPSRIGTSLPRK